MQIKNNYQIEWEIVGRYNIPIDKGMGVFNGDMGRVKEINDTMSTLLVEFDDGRRVNYPFSALEELELSYAITIHKSQGSEYPAVILPLLGGPRMLFNRNLLYTGITRARNCVTILGSSETVRNMIENVSENRRYTGLEQRIRRFAACRKMIHRRRKTKREPEIAERDQKNHKQNKGNGITAAVSRKMPGL